MNDYGAQAQLDFMRRLLEADAASSLQGIAALGEIERREAAAEPLRWFVSLGLRPPPGIRIDIAERRLDGPGDLPDGFDPDGPPLLREICIRICRHAQDRVFVEQCLVICIYF